MATQNKQSAGIMVNGGVLISNLTLSASTHESTYVRIRIFVCVLMYIFIFVVVHMYIETFVYRYRLQKSLHFALSTYKNVVLVCCVGFWNHEVSCKHSVLCNQDVYFKHSNVIDLGKCSCAGDGIHPNRGDANFRFTVEGQQGKHNHGNLGPAQDSICKKEGGVYACVFLRMPVYFSFRLRCLTHDPVLTFF